MIYSACYVTHFEISSVSFSDFSLENQYMHVTVSESHSCTNRTGDSISMWLELLHGQDVTVIVQTVDGFQASLTLKV